MLNKVRIAFRDLRQRNTWRARRNIAQHYDLNERLYGLWIRPSVFLRLFEFLGQSLEDAQTAKKRHIAAKLLPEDGATALDIGCGFGGLGLYLAGVAGARVTGVTLSEEQFAVATSRARQTGLADRVEFRLQDYRDVSETFDRIVSVGMFEHVGASRYDEFFTKVRTLLKDDGVMLLHSIGRNLFPALRTLIANIFPGGWHSEPVRSAAGDRAGGSLRDGRGNPAAPLPRRCGFGANGLWRVEMRLQASTTNASAACEFHLAGSETSFRVDATW